MVLMVRTLNSLLLLCVGSHPLALKEHEAQINRLRDQHIEFRLDFPASSSYVSVRPSSSCSSSSSPSASNILNTAMWIHEHAVFRGLALDPEARLRLVRLHSLSSQGKGRVPGIEVG